MRLFIFILIVILHGSCTKEVEITIPNNGTQFVVNGYIENGKPATILLTRSLSYFAPQNYDNIFSSFIEGATIQIISETGETEILNYVGPQYHDTWMYNYIGNSIIGEEGQTYRIRINKGDTLLTSIASIPNIAGLNKDSLRFLYRPFDSTYCYLYGFYQDPDTIGNSNRIFTRTNQDPLFAPNLDQNGNYNDEYVNGDGLGFPMYKGRGFWQDWDYGEDWEEVDGVCGPTIGFWCIGDSVELKMSSVNRAYWDFWNSIQYNNPGGPFGNPSDVISNINGGLGVWGGVSSEKINLIADPSMENPIVN